MPCLATVEALDLLQHKMLHIGVMRDADTPVHLSDDKRPAVWVIGGFALELVSFAFPLSLQEQQKWNSAGKVTPAHSICLRRRKLCLTLALVELALASSLQKHRANIICANAKWSLHT